MDVNNMFAKYAVEYCCLITMTRVTNSSMTYPIVMRLGSPLKRLPIKSSVSHTALSRATANKYLHIILQNDGLANIKSNPHSGKTNRRTAWNPSLANQVEVDLRPYL